MVGRQKPCLNGHPGYAKIAAASNIPPAYSPLAYTFFARQEWSSTAITDRPTVNMLGGYYSQQQFLRNLDVRSNMASADQPSVMDEAYKEFVMQLASWDTRREFWLKTDYYKQRMVGNSKADAALLDEMINNIQFIPGDFTRAVKDSVKLIAETAPDEQKTYTPARLTQTPAPCQ